MRRGHFLGLGGCYNRRVARKQIIACVPIYLKLILKAFDKAFPRKLKIVLRKVFPCG